MFRRAAARCLSYKYCREFETRHIAQSFRLHVFFFCPPGGAAQAAPGVLPPTAADPTINATKYPQELAFCRSIRTFPTPDLWGFMSTAVGDAVGAVARFNHRIGRCDSVSNGRGCEHQLPLSSLAILRNMGNRNDA
jgi:hypothetical protein